MYLSPGKQKRRERAREKYMERERNGLCVICSVPLPDGHETKLCQKCRDKQKQYCRERYAYLKMSGGCVWCGKIAREGFVLCMKCAIAQSERRGKGRGDKNA